MAHKSTLKIDRKEYNVIECEYEFVKPIKENGQPAGKSSGGLIHLTIVSPDNNDMFLYDWMQSATEHKDGQVVFTVVEMENQTTKTLHFKRAFCIRLYEYFNAHGNIQMYTKITISASEMSCGASGNIVFKND